LGGKTQKVLKVAVQCGRGQGKGQHMRSRCGQRRGFFCPCHPYRAVHNCKNIRKLVKQGSRISD